MLTRVLIVALLVAHVGCAATTRTAPRRGLIASPDQTRLRDLRPEQRQALRQGMLAGFDLLYVPAAVTADELATLAIRTPDGVDHVFTRDDVMDVAFDHVAVCIPSELQRGTMSVTTTAGRTDETTFEIAAPASAPTFGLTRGSRDPGCASLAGDWVDVSDSAEVRLRLVVLPACAGIQGVMPSDGSVRTVVGTWADGELTLHDGQLFDRAVPLDGATCQSTYRLVLSDDGRVLDGARSGCDDATIHLTRVTR
jgi:hypothetical protein